MDGTCHSPKPKPAKINSRTCGWCGAVAMRGPFKHPDYETRWYLCDYCAENVDGMEPALESIVDGYAASVVVKVDGDVVARYPDGTYPPVSDQEDEQ